MVSASRFGLLEPKRAMRVRGWRKIGAAVVRWPGPILIATVALALVGLGGEDQKRPAEISGGQQQRVTIARALVNDPAIVWADEPTGNLDSETSAQVMDLLCRLNKEKSQTFVLVTHDIAVGRRANRILRMADGEIVEELYVGGG